MASSIEVRFPKDQWYKVTTAVSNGNISKIEDSAVYRYTYVATGAEAPPEDKRGVAWTEKTLIIDSISGSIDVYIKATNKDGIVEVML